VTLRSGPPRGNGTGQKITGQATGQMLKDSGGGVPAGLPGGVCGSLLTRSRSPRLGRRLLVADFRGSECDSGSMTTVCQAPGAGDHRGSHARQCKASVNGLSKYFSLRMVERSRLTRRNFPGRSDPAAIPRKRNFGFADRSTLTRSTGRHVRYPAK
jgi:hypothetical protein